MRLVACGTLPFGIGCVSIFELLGQLGMAGETGLRRTGNEQPIQIRGMGIVAALALSLPDRLMDKALTLQISNLFVTGVAQLFHL
jgi:hypothetical protein